MLSRVTSGRTPTPTLHIGLECMVRKLRKSTVGGSSSFLITGFRCRRNRLRRSSGLPRVLVKTRFKLLPSRVLISIRPVACCIRVLAIPALRSICRYSTHLASFVLNLKSKRYTRPEWYITFFCLLMLPGAVGSYGAIRQQAFAGVLLPPEASSPRLSTIPLPISLESSREFRIPGSSLTTRINAEYVTQ